MEAVVFRSSPEKPNSPYKKGAAAVTNGVLNRHPSISRPSENFVPALNLFHNNTGLLQAPPSQLLLPPNYTPFHSYPPFSMQQQKQPPLLPLPISSTKPTQPAIMNNGHVKLPGITRGLSLPPPATYRKPHNKANIRSRDYSSSFTPRKSKTVKEKSSKPLGPDPKDLPKDVHVPKTLSLFSLSASGGTSHNNHREAAVVDDQFSAASVVFTISPPPSSLPLPTFSLRPKLSCNAEADAGATDDLRRLLRLR